MEIFCNPSRVVLMLLQHYELPVGFKPSSSSSTSRATNAKSEDFEIEVYIEIQSYNKVTDLSLVVKLVRNEYTLTGRRYYNVLK